MLVGLLLALAHTPPVSDAANAGESDLGLRSGGPMRGHTSAPVTLIEYSDFTCGYCSKFFRETWPRLQSKYVETGKVRFLYRDYPRSDRGAGLDAALAARCAGEQHQYWAMHDFLFASGGRVSAADVQRQAKALRLNVGDFTACLKDDRRTEAVFEDRAEGSALGFRGTPGFILVLTEHPERQAAIMIPGAFPFEVFEEHIERLLKTAVPK